MKYASERSTLALKPRAESPEVQNRGISGLTKRTDILQFKKKRGKPRTDHLPILALSSAL